MSQTKARGGPKRLRAYLPGGLTSALSRHTDDAGRLRQAWHARMPEPLATHAHPVRYSDGLLYVHVDTPAWASRLRLQLPTLTASLKKEPPLRDLVEVRFRVVPRGAAPDAPVSAAPPSRVSAAAAAVIRRSAADIANPELRAALERLARRNESSSPAKRRR